MAKRAISDATEALGLLRRLTQIANEARLAGWTVNISVEIGATADSISFAAHRPIMDLEQ